MPEIDADTKATRLMRLTRLFTAQPGRTWTAVELARELGCNPRTIVRYIAELELNRRLPLVDDGRGHYSLMEGGQVALADLKLDLREGMALYLAARLLAQQTDEYNLHVMNALDKLVGAMPGELAEGLRGLVGAAAVARSRGMDVTEIFSSLVLGWAHRRVVALRYRPARAPAAYSCQVHPYLFEPSGIGRTIYIIGYAEPPGALRTFKLERIQAARLLDETFVMPEHFDGAALLSTAWGVMYGDEAPVTVHLRFSRYVAQRVKETVWHASQRITDLPDGGCEWEATIGDATEIGPWVRGWGRDCEVLAPEELRADVIKHVRHMAHSYGIGEMSSAQIEPGGKRAITPEERATLDDIFG